MCECIYRSVCISVEVCERVYISGDMNMPVRVSVCKCVRVCVSVCYCVCVCECISVC